MQRLNFKGEEQVNTLGISLVFPPSIANEHKVCVNNIIIVSYVAGNS